MNLGFRGDARVDFEEVQRYCPAGFLRESNALARLRFYLEGLFMCFSRNDQILSQPSTACSCL